MNTALALAEPAELAEVRPRAIGFVTPQDGGVLVHVVNPMVPQLGARRSRHCEGLTVTEAIARAGWKLDSSTVLLRDRELVRRADWDERLIGYGETVLLITLPQGGKGGASQIFAVVASIALALFAPEIGGFLLSQIGLSAGTIAFAGITYGALATVGVVLAGTMLISALLPRPKPISGQTATQNPSYSLNNGTNLPKLLSAIPERFGRTKFLPDLASQPFTDFVNSNQELMMEFCLGMGEFDIEEVGVANNPVWSGGSYTGTYPEIELQFLSPGDANTLFSNNVVTSSDVSNIEMLGTNEDGYGWSGPYILNPAGSLAHRLEIDISLPAGLFTVDSKGNLKAASISFQVQVQTIDDDASPTGDWTSVITQTINASTRDAVRTSYGADIGAARYQVRFERTNAKATDLNTSDTLAALSMRGFLPNATAPADTSRLAVKATATKNLNGDAAQQFYVIATRKLPIYDADTARWSANTATRSIAWASAYLCRATNGLRRADNQVDLAKLAALDAIWTDRSDTFDDVFDQGDSAWTNLQTLLHAGRAQPLRVGRYITFDRDEPKSVPRAAFSPANMLAGSFNIDYLMFDPNSTDAVWVDFVDERNWQPNSVFCALPDSTTDPDDAPHFPGGGAMTPGIVNRDQAWREGIFLVACNRYRRRFPNFNTELEGRVCFRGNRIVVAHWMTNWGGSASVLALQQDPAGDILTLSEPWVGGAVEFDDSTKIFSVATPDGQAYGPVTIDLIDDGQVSGKAQVRLTQTASVAVGKYAGDQPRDWPVWEGEGLTWERPRCTFGTANQQAQDALMLSMQPQSGNTVQIACVIEDERVHYADGTIPPVEGAMPTPPAETSTPVAPAADNLTIAGLIKREIAQAGGVTQANTVSFIVQGAADAVSFDVQWRWNDATDWEPIQRGQGRTFNVPAITGNLTVQVRAVGESGSGAWFASNIAVTGVPPNPSAPTNTLTITTVTAWASNATDGSWSWAADPDAIDYIVDVQFQATTTGTTWHDAGSIGFGTSTAFTYDKTLNTQALTDDDGGTVTYDLSAVRIGVKPVYPAGPAADWVYST